MGREGGSPGPGEFTSTGRATEIRGFGPSVAGSFSGAGSALRQGDLVVAKLNPDQAKIFQGWIQAKCKTAPVCAVCSHAVWDIVGTGAYPSWETDAALRVVNAACANCAHLITFSAAPIGL